MPTTTRNPSDSGVGPTTTNPPVDMQPPPPAPDSPEEDINGAEAGGAAGEQPGAPRTQKKSVTFALHETADADGEEAGREGTQTGSRTLAVGMKYVLTNARGE